MVIRFFPKLALATVAAVGLYIPTIGLPVQLGACLRTVGVASATPSPTCGGDERECLRRSAKTGLYGVRYVTPEDVAKCVEAFNACIHGTLNSGNPAPPTETTSGDSNRKTLPQHFGINYNGVVASDCRASGDTVTCKDIRQDPLAEDQDSWTGGVTGTLSGLTMTGTKTIHIEGHYSGEPGCFYTQEATGPATHVFNSDGTVTMREGPLQWQKTNHGSCSGGDSPQTSPATEVTANWSAIE